MKRLLLIAILVFPVLSLAAWLYWGSRPAQKISNGATNGIAAPGTNLSDPLPNR